MDLPKFLHLELYQNETSKCLYSYKDYTASRA